VIKTQIAATFFPASAGASSAYARDRRRDLPAELRAQAIAKEAVEHVTH
jgi:hypothetical protein